MCNNYTILHLCYFAQKALTFVRLSQNSTEPLGNTHIFIFGDFGGFLMDPGRLRNFQFRTFGTVWKGLQRFGKVWHELSGLQRFCKILCNILISAGGWIFHRFAPKMCDFS